MKAPDKIYIHTRTEPYCSITWSEVKEKNCTNEEYIRKDALLVWAKEKFLEYNKFAMDWKERKAFQQMIDKLNSL